MIDLNKIYTFEECGKLCGKTEYYFKQKVDNRELISLARDPKKPFMKAVYGRHLVRFLQKYKFGIKLLESWNMEKLPDDYFIDDDIMILEESLKHLLEVKEKRVEALYNTISKIKSTEDKIQKLHSIKTLTKIF